MHLAQQLGAKIIAEKEVYNVLPLGNDDGSDGYKIDYKSRLGRKTKYSVTAKGVIFSGGVMGTVPLLLELKDSTLPNLSDTVGHNVRTNNESLMLLTSTKKKF